MGGEKILEPSMGVGNFGSPPRGRGKADVLFSQFFARRITPAWAGKSPKRDTAVAVNGDHPRVGGEKHLSGTTDNRPQGSPPHGRGKVHTGDKAACLDRITPAWAGKSSRAPWAIFPARDHPRVGGEKFTAYAKIWNEWGSPPRGRGKGDFHIVTHTKVGITPAWAGKRSWARLAALLSWDHPRMGGEKGQACPCTRKPQGSPPHGRGKAPHAVSCASWVWITPAWAGKRGRNASGPCKHGDHPRVGGEKCVPVSWATGPAGSPPRRRGKALVPLGRGAAFRITPA